MSLPEIIETIRIGLMKAGLGALALIVGGGVLFALWRTVRWPLVTTWRLLGWSGKAMVTILCAVCIFLAGGKNEGLRGTGNSSITPEEIAQGYRLESVVTNDAVSYSIPTDGVEYARWSIRGGRETRFALDPGDFYFPFGTGTLHRFDVLSGGRIESLPRLSLATICAAREWASLVPGEGRFWWADAAVTGLPPYQGTQAVTLLTWEGVYAGRDRTGQYNAQIELRAGGDFAIRSNNVECVYRRVPPFDWDDDGLENSVDPDPLVAGPDAHGTNAEWYNTVCSNVLEAVASGSTGTTGVLPVEDGQLSSDECDLVVGWDCGMWFVENGTTGERVTAAPAGGCGAHELTVRMRIDHHGAVDDVLILDNGVEVFAEFAATKPQWLHSPAWNRLRLVGRGENVRAGERFFAQITPQGTSVRLR
jgi:hypothetical protein